MMALQHTNLFLEKDALPLLVVHSACVIAQGRKEGGSKGFRNPNPPSLRKFRLLLQAGP